MPPPPVPLIVGNWKMNGLSTALAEIDRLGALLAGLAAPRAKVAICPPATLLAAMAPRAAALGIAVGGQDCHFHAQGAHTGDLAAAMLKDAGATYVIVGHSERRADHGEGDELVRLKAEAALAAGLVPIICVGETRAEREAGLAAAVVARQLAASVPQLHRAIGLAIAYEPVWAIGTGLTPTGADIAQMHAGLRAGLVARFDAHGAGVPLLYGGSLKPGNAGEILALPEVGGGLVGGASLKAEDFFAIVAAA